MRPAQKAWLRATPLGHDRWPARRVATKTGGSLRRPQAASLFGRLDAVAQHRLGLEELGEGVVAPFAPVARHLVAAEGGHHIAAGAVNADLARPQLRGHFAEL